MHATCVKQKTFMMQVDSRHFAHAEPSRPSGEMRSCECVKVPVALRRPSEAFESQSSPPCCVRRKHSPSTAPALTRPPMPSQLSGAAS